MLQKGLTLPFTVFLAVAPKVTRNNEMMARLAISAIFGKCSLVRLSQVTMK